MHIERRLPVTVPAAPAVKTQPDLPQHVLLPHKERRQRNRRRNRPGGRRTSDERAPEGQVRTEHHEPTASRTVELIASEHLLFALRHNRGPR